MALTTANDVANYILCHFRDKSEDIDHLKLQKLVYYCQAWYLALYGTPLFDDELQAWIHGPVQPSLYQRFKVFRWMPILLDDIQCPEDMPQESKDHINEVLGVYSGYSGEELESIVHQEKPWLDARKGFSQFESCSQRIDEKTMEDFYYKMSQE